MNGPGSVHALTIASRWSGERVLEILDRHGKVVCDIGERLACLEAVEHVAGSWSLPPGLPVPPAGWVHRVRALIPAWKRSGLRRRCSEWQRPRYSVDLAATAMACAANALNWSEWRVGMVSGQRRDLHDVRAKSRRMSQSSQLSLVSTVLASEVISVFSASKAFWMPARSLADSNDVIAESASASRG